MIYRRKCPVCTLPRATTEDLARWRAEVPDGDGPAIEPAWASDLCWTKPEAKCIGVPPPACSICAEVRRGRRNAAGAWECNKCRQEPAREARATRLERSYEPVTSVGGLKAAIEHGSKLIGAPKAKRVNPIVMPARPRSKGATLHRVPMTVDGRTLDRDEAAAMIVDEDWYKAAHKVTYLGSTAGFHLFEVPLQTKPEPKLKRGQHGATSDDEPDAITAACSIFDEDD